MPNGRMVSVVAAATDTPVLAAPTAKKFVCTRFVVNNRSGSAVRVQVWDTFTDSAGVVHSSTAVPVPVIDLSLAIGAGIDQSSEDGLFQIIGTAVARSDVAAAVPADVAVGLYGRFEGP